MSCIKEYAHSLGQETIFSYAPAVGLRELAMIDREMRVVGRLVKLERDIHTSPLQGYYRDAFEMNDARQVVTTIDRLHMDSSGNNYDAPDNQ